MVRRIAITDSSYNKALEAAVDVLFDYAARELEWDWDTLAAKAHLHVRTVERLGMRKTKLPRWQTFWKLAMACNLRPAFIDPGTRKEVSLNGRKPQLRLFVAA